MVAKGLKDHQKGLSPTYTLGGKQEMLIAVHGRLNVSNRQILPQRRFAETFDLEHGDQRTVYKITVGYFGPGRPAEVFITGAKAGSSLEAVARDGAVLLSLAMQYGIPLDVIRGAITRNEDGSPSTIIGAVVDRLVQEVDIRP